MKATWEWVLLCLQDNERMAKLRCCTYIIVSEDKYWSGSSLKVNPYKFVPCSVNVELLKDRSRIISAAMPPTHLVLCNEKCEDNSLRGWCEFLTIDETWRFRNFLWNGDGTEVKMVCFVTSQFRRKEEEEEFGAHNGRQRNTCVQVVPQAKDLLIWIEQLFRTLNRTIILR
jgi:hypothetical protein